MAERNKDDPVEDEPYDEEADSDFSVDDADEIPSASSDDEKPALQDQPRKRHKDVKASVADVVHVDLDSGDEATIKEQQKAKRRAKKHGATSDSEGEADGWRARTRAMRAQDQEEKKRNKLATVKGSTIDVNRLWEELNKPRLLPPVRIEEIDIDDEKTVSQAKNATTATQDKENLPEDPTEEMIVIKRKYKFAGEVHIEEKKVLKSSAEARLWLAQKDRNTPLEAESMSGVQRPLRKVSRFDPNYNNIAAFKMNWSRHDSREPFKGPKLNVVEKSKMDWAVHVDKEGLKEELDIHAKAREGYHGRMDFLTQVEQRREEEARAARSKG